MTLRVTISIVPHGDESKEKIIEVINISNLGTTDFKNYEYAVEHNEYKEITNETPRVFHKRSHSPLELVRKSLVKILSKN